MSDATHVLSRTPPTHLGLQNPPPHTLRSRCTISFRWQWRSASATCPPRGSRRSVGRSNAPKSPSPSRRNRACQSCGRRARGGGRLRLRFRSPTEGTVARASRRATTSDERPTESRRACIDGQRRATRTDGAIATDGPRPCRRPRRSRRARRRWALRARTASGAWAPRPPPWLRARSRRAACRRARARERVVVVVVSGGASPPRRRSGWWWCVGGRAPW